MNISEKLSAQLHKVFLVLKPLKVGILNPHLADIWFISSESVEIGKENPEAKDYKQSDLRNFKVRLIQHAQGTSLSEKVFTWTEHPLIAFSYKIINILGIRFLKISHLHSRFFDEKFYLARYPEVRSHNENPLFHYLKYGFFTLNQPSDGVFNISPNADWQQKDQSLEVKRKYLWDEARRRELLEETDKATLEDVANQIHLESISPHQNLIRKVVGDIPNSETPKFSVIIPCYKQASFLQDCLVSVSQATDQLHECVIVDDGNEDPLDLEIIDSLKPVSSQQRVLIVRQQNTGLSGARNSGLDHSSGEFIKFLDSDDLLCPNSLDIQSQNIEKYATEADICGYQVSGSDQQILAEAIGPVDGFPLQKGGGLDPNQFLRVWEEEFSLPIHSLLIRKDDAPRFKEHLRSKEDLRMWLELGAKSISFSLSEGISAIYRQHPGQMTASSRARHGVYFIESIYDFDTSFPGVMDLDVLRTKLGYLKNFYGTAALLSWSNNSVFRSNWLAGLNLDLSN